MLAVSPSPKPRTRHGFWGRTRGGYYQKRSFFRVGHAYSYVIHADEHPQVVWMLLCPIQLRVVNLANPELRVFSNFPFHDGGAARARAVCRSPNSHDRLARIGNSLRGCFAILGHNGAYHTRDPSIL